jgi:hypothetical protein
LNPAADQDLYYICVSDFELDPAFQKVPDPPIMLVENISGVRNLLFFSEKILVFSCLLYLVVYKESHSPLRPGF